MCVGLHMKVSRCVGVCVCVCVRGQFVGVSSPSIMWGPEVEYSGQSPSEPQDLSSSRFCFKAD